MQHWEARGLLTSGTIAAMAIHGAMARNMASAKASSRPQCASAGGAISMACGKNFGAKKKSRSDG